MNRSIWENDNLDRLADEAAYRREQIDVCDQLIEQFDAPAEEQVEAPVEQPKPWIEQYEQCVASKAKKQKLPLTFDNLMELVAACQELADKAEPEGYTRTFRIYSRVLLPFLDGDEYKVLTILLEEIYGFHHDNPEDGYKHCITLDRFTLGQKDKTKTKYIALGCGMSEDTVQKHLKTLAAFGIGCITALNNPDDNHGNEWFLQPDYSKIKWEALWERRERKLAKGRERMEPARNCRKNTTPPRKTKRSR